MDYSDRCAVLMGHEILPISQYFAYIEVSTEATLRHTYQSSRTNLWRTYATISECHRNFAMHKVADRSQIFPVFHELFAGRREHAA